LQLDNFYNSSEAREQFHEMQVATMTEQPQRVHAVDSVKHITRAALVRAALEESGQRLRLCATRDATAEERRTLLRLRTEHSEELRRAATVLAQATDDAPVLREAAQDRLLGELQHARRLELQQEQRQEEEEEEEDSVTRLVLEERRAALAQIETDVGHMQQITLDLSLIAALQNAPLEQAAAELEATVQSSNETVEELGQAEKAANAGRKRRFWLVLGVVAVILTAGVALVVWKLV
jgi:hypothetical protein